MKATLQQIRAERAAIAAALTADAPDTVLLNVITRRYTPRQGTRIGRGSVPHSRPGRFSPTRNAARSMAGRHYETSSRPPKGTHCPPNGTQPGSRRAQVSRRDS